MVCHFTEIVNTYAQETLKDWPCSVLSTILVLFVLFYIPDIANAQEQGKILDTSTIGDNQNQIMSGPLYDNSSVYANPANVNFSSYENFDLGIRTKYSNDWNFRESPVVETEYVTFFFPHLEHNSDTLVDSNRGNLSIIAHPHSQDLSTVKEDFNDTIDYYESLRYSGREDLRNFTLIDSTPPYLLQIRGPQSYNVTYSYEERGSGITIIVTNITTIQNERLYTISYSFPREEYAYYARIVNNMINSIEFFTPRFEPDTKLGLLLHYPSDFRINHTNNTGITLQSIPDSNEKPEFVINVSKEGGSNYNKTNCKSMQSLAFTLNTTLAQLIPADKRFFTCQTNDGTVNVLQVNATFKDRIYNFTYRAEPLEFSQSVSTIEGIINSTKIIDSPSVRQVDCNVAKNIENSTYSSPYGFTTVYDPSYWYEPKEDYGNGALRFTPIDDSLPSLTVSVRPSEDKKLLDFVEDAITSSAVKYSDFKINLSNQTSPSSYDLEFIGDGKMTKIRFILNDKTKNLYSLYYNANLDEFYRSKPIIEQMTHPNCFTSEPNGKSRTYTGFKVGDKPLGIAVNDIRNTIYVANSLNRSVSAINSSNNEVLSNISVINEPKAIAVNPFTNTIYVTQTGSVSVIDGKNNTLKANIPLDMKSPKSIAVNPSTDTVYVADGDSKNITVIDGTMNKKKKDIQLETDDGAERPQDQLGEIGIAVDPIRNRVYAANPSTASVTVIDGSDNSILVNIPTFPPIEDPHGIAVNPFTNLAYVVGTHGFAEIDLSGSNAVSRYYHNISGYLVKGPMKEVAINPFRNSVYIIDPGQNAIYVIDPRLDKLVTKVTMDIFPTSASVDRYTDTVYVTNSGSDTVSRINGTTPNVTNVIYGAKFDVNDQLSYYEIPFIGIKIPVYPSTSVNIECSAKTISDDEYVKKTISDDEYVNYMNGTRLKCSARSMNDFSPLIQSSWSGFEIQASQKSSLLSRILQGSQRSGFDDGNSVLSRILQGSQRSGFDDGNPDNEFTVTHYETVTGTFIDLGRLFQTIGPYLSVIVLVAVVLAASMPSFLPKIKKVFGTAEEGPQKFVPQIPDTGKEETTVIKKSDIITIDASVIVGVLIFITFTQGFDIAEQTQITMITANIVFPFAISAVVAVRNYDEFATRLMIAGFINLMISIILIAIMKLS
jgi:YVTN family beta-propeller protein